MPKPKIALYWCASCGGCEESVMDLAADILEVIAGFEIVFWPVALDFKLSDVEALADDSLAATLINGAIQTDEQEETVKLLRRKSQLVFAQGSCAHLGGVVGLANFYPPEEILKRAYQQVPSVNNPRKILPAEENKEQGSKLPRLQEKVRPLNKVITVDYYIPGCPSTPELIKEALLALKENRLPEKGSVLAPQKALCEACSRRQSKPEKIKIKEWKRLSTALWDDQQCFLRQGIICLGPATRAGCQERCIKANFPCRGCFGPLNNVQEQGAKSLSFLASLLETSDEKEIQSIINSLPDPAGLFYRYSLAASLLKGNDYVPQD